jgi:hypothetical protein
LGYTYAGPAFVLDAASDAVCVLGVFARAASAIASSAGDARSSSATSAEVACDARAACASLIACCATAVALSRIDCGSEGFALTSVSNESAVCRRTTAEAKDIHVGNDAYKSFPKLYRVFRLTPILSHPPPSCYPRSKPGRTANKKEGATSKCAAHSLGRSSYSGIEVSVDVSIACD